MKALRVSCLLLLVLPLLSLTGCVTSRGSDAIQVSLVNVRLVQSTLWETTAIFTIRLVNASPDLAVVTGGRHQFYLDGSFLGQGLSGERLTLARLSSATQDVTVHWRNLTLVRRIRPILEQQRFSYRVESVLYRERAGQVVRARVSNSGHLDLREFQPTQPGD